MSDAFSSEDAEEVSEQGYETLEEYIFETDRNKEEEQGKSIRFREWQEMQLRIIKDKLGTNATEVVARSYLMGLSRLRDKHHDDVDEVSDMLTDFLIAIGQDDRNEGNVLDIQEDIMSIEIDEPSQPGSNLGEPKRYKIKESALSEVENTYVQDAFFGGWIHRYVAALGLLDSKFLSNITESKLSSYSSSVALSMEQTRDEIEGLIMDYISMSQSHWIMEGVSEDVHSKLEDVVGLMDTDRQEPCERLLEHTEQYIEEPEDENNVN